MYSGHLFGLGGGIMWIFWLFIIVLAFYFIKDIFMLRLATLVGCTLMGVYYTHIDVAQGMVSNVILVLINAFYLLFQQQNYFFLLLVIF